MCGEKTNSEKAAGCFEIAQKTADPYMKAFYENAGIGYLYKACREKGTHPVVAINKPYREDGNYIGTKAGVPDLDEFYGVRDITVYEYDQDMNILSFDYWDAEGNRCHRLLDN